MHLSRFALVAAVAACGAGHKGYKPPAQLPTAEAVVAQIATARAARTSFKVETTMDYMLGKQRVKGTVWVMGTAQRQLRFNAVKPTGDVLVDMACDGTAFTYVDYQNNCMLSGPCNKQSVASLLQVELEPEDFHALAQGTPPVIAEATGTVTWDADRGYERVQLSGAAGRQTLVIDARDGRFDVVEAELVDPSGAVKWSVKNKDFRVVKDASGATYRVPGVTQFKSPAKDADLIVNWKDDAREVNLPLEPGKFTVAIPAGIPRCNGALPQATPAP
jgi:hypothetical protein